MCATSLEVMVRTCRLERVAERHLGWAVELRDNIGWVGSGLCAAGLGVMVRSCRLERVAVGHLG